MHVVSTRGRRAPRAGGGYDEREDSSRDEEARRASHRGASHHGCFRLTGQRMTMSKRTGLDWHSHMSGRGECVVAGRIASSRPLDARKGCLRPRHLLCEKIRHTPLRVVDGTPGNAAADEADVTAVSDKLDL